MTSSWGWLHQHFALNQGTPKSCVLFYPQRNALMISLPHSSSVSILRLLVICRNNATSLLEIYFVALHKFLWCLGLLDYSLEQTYLQKNKAKLEPFLTFSRSCFPPFSFVIDSKQGLSFFSFFLLENFNWKLKKVLATIYYQNCLANVQQKPFKPL